MNIRKTVVAKLVETLGQLDKTSRKKALTSEDVSALNAGLLRAVRSVLTTLRKLK